MKQMRELKKWVTDYNFLKHGIEDLEILMDFEKIGDLVINLSKKFSKRMLVLFTSTKTLTDTAKYIKKESLGYKIPLFAQIKGASRPAIIKGLEDNPNGVVFGTNSFWEGVDFPGDLLEILILVKQTKMP